MGGGCGAFDTEDFHSNEMCCSCGGGVRPELKCDDTNGDFGDLAGDKCDWYEEHTSGCGMYDTDDFKSEGMCCACLGGTWYQEPEVCFDMNGFGEDTGGDDCTWYWDYQDWCGAFDDDDFTASEMCCACTDPDAFYYFNLAALESCFNLDEVEWTTDSFGDGCAWYKENPGYCGVYDTDDFKANELCCDCEGGLPFEADCEELNFGFGDVGGDKCDWYANNPEQCGWWDTDYFDASSMCCACEGGATTVCANESGPYKDSGGEDGCEWYVGNEEWCGFFDDDDFESKYCCACGGAAWINAWSTNLKSDELINEGDYNTQFIIGFLAVCSIAVALSYQSGKKSVVTEKKTRLSVQNNVTEKLI